MRPRRLALLVGALAAALGAKGTAGDTGYTGAIAASQGRVDLLISGGTVVTMDAEARILRQGGIAITGDRIQAIYAAGDRLPEARRRIDASGHLVIPGLVNTHGHAAMTLLRGIADDRSLLDWLNEFIFPAERRNVDADFVYQGTLLGCVEMARSGTTTFADMYYFEDAAARATAECGLRGVLAGTIIGTAAPDFETAEASLADSERFLATWADHPLVTPSVSVQALYTTSLDIAARAHALARRHKVLFQIHAVEPPEENEIVEALLGRRTVPALDGAGILGPGTLLHHAVWLSDTDIELIAAAGAAVSHNPESNMKTASGVARVPDLRAAGATVGLGTDGAASNNNLDLFEEMDTAAKLHKLVRRDPTVLSAPEVFRMATIEGAAALGMADRIGSLEPGKLADVVLVRLQEPELTPMYDVYSHLVYAIKGAHVSTVMVNGVVIVESRRVLTVDVDALEARANAIRRRVIDSLESLDPVRQR